MRTAHPASWLARGAGVLTLCVLLLGLGCSPIGVSSGDGPAPSCTKDVASSCPGSPGFQEIVLPTIESKCHPCHAPGGKEAARPFTTYADIQPQRSSMLTQLASCAMPPSDGAPLSDAERKLILDWLVCGAPND